MEGGAAFEGGMGEGWGGGEVGEEAKEEGGRGGRGGGLVLPTRFTDSLINRFPLALPGAWEVYERGEAVDQRFMIVVRNRVIKLAGQVSEEGGGGGDVLEETEEGEVVGELGGGCGHGRDDVGCGEGLRRENRGLEQ